MRLPAEYPDFGAIWLRHSLFPELPDSLAVGWSGGADSTALLLALRAAGYKVMAWHVDHGWRDGSAAEARQLAEQARCWGIRFCSARLPSVPRSNPEAAARQARYRQFLQWSETFAIDCLCLGHHLDDQAETVCMRMLQGAGVNGCRGMPRERRQGGLRIVRPLLHVRAAELRAALQAAGVSWLEDATNDDVRFRRNAIRHRLFPAMAAAGTDPQALFLRWARQADMVGRRLDREARLLLAATEQEQETVSVRWREWRAASPAVRARALQLMVSRLLGEGMTPGRRHIQLAETWTRKSGLGGLDLSGCRLQRRRKFLHLEARRAGLP